MRLDVRDKRMDQLGLVRVLSPLHFLFFRSHQLDFLPRRLLLLDFEIEQAHQVLDFVHLALDFEPCLVALRHALVELIVGLFNFGDGLRFGHQVLGQLFLNGRG